MLQVGGVSLRATHAIGMAKSLYVHNLQFILQQGPTTLLVAQELDPETIAQLLFRANSCYNKFCQDGNLLALNNMIKAYEFIEAYEFVFDFISMQFPGLIDRIGCFLAAQFSQKGDIKDLEKAISLHQEALELQPVPDPYHASSLNNLGNVLGMRFQQMGNIKDVNKAIFLL
jgi:hypothetical protein